LGLANKKSTHCFSVSGFFVCGLRAFIGVSESCLFLPSALASLIIRQFIDFNGIAYFECALQLHNYYFLF